MPGVGLGTVKILLKITSVGVELCANSHTHLKYSGDFTHITKPLNNGGEREKVTKMGGSSLTRRPLPSLTLSRARAIKGFLKLK